MTRVRVAAASAGPFEARLASTALGEQAGTVSDSASPTLWILRVSWAAQPLLTGAELGSIWANGSQTFTMAATAIAWAVWAVGLAGLAIPRPETLVGVRLAVPTGLVAALTTAAVEPSVASVVGLAAASVATLVALLPEFANWCVDGVSYGAERRYLLSPPVAMAIGPIPLAGLVAVSGLLGGPLLLAAEQWGVGAVATAVGIPAAVVAIRALLALVRRWLVLVPAGVVVHDHLALAEPTLFRSAETAIAPAREGTDAHDLTSGAAGVPLQISLNPPKHLHLAQRRGDTVAVVAPDVPAILVSPNRPGAVLHDLGERSWASPRAERDS